VVVAAVGAVCNIYGKLSGDSGSGDDLDDWKRHFKVAWATIRAGLTDEDIAKLHKPDVPAGST
jgi:hypothetical protein